MRRAISTCLLLVIGALGTSSPAQAAERPRCHGQVATIIGTDHSDDIVGTAGRDVIVAGKGGDQIDGRGGDDVICGQGGADTIDGGRGDDLLDGGRDALDRYSKYGPDLYGDVLSPGPGNDTIHPGWDPRQRSYGQRADTVRFGGTRGVSVTLGDPGRWGTATGQGRDRILGQPQVEVWGTHHDDVINGADGDDSLIGNGGDDRLVAGAGDDYVVDHVDFEVDSRSGTDVLDGGPGDDYVSSVDGPDQLGGGDGDDELTSQPGQCADHDGGEGQDALTLDARNAVLTYDGGASAVGDNGVCGTTASTEAVTLSSIGTVSYRGTDGPDDVVVWAGTVTASLLGGDDEIRTGYGDDVIDAGAGIDTVNALDGVDVCDNAETAHNCESGTNLPVPSCEGRAATIVVTRSSSTWPPAEPVTGTSGDDVILGSEYDDVIDAGAGNDIICGGAGSDTLTGGEGDDRLFGGLDALVVMETSRSWHGDTLVPGPGDDHLDGGWDEQRLVDGWSSSVDTVDFSSSRHPITADLAAGTVTGQGTDTVKALPQHGLIATAYDDRITGGPSDDTIWGGDGADVIDSGAGDDSVVAHSAALLAGGSGIDQIELTVASLRGTVTLHAGQGTLRDEGHLDLAITGWEGFELHSPKVPWRFVGTRRDEEFVVRGARRVEAFGRGGDDVLKGTAGSDRLVGGSGRDQATGLQGDDLCVSVEEALGCERSGPA